MQIIEQLVPGNHDVGRAGHAITGIVLHTMVGTIDSAYQRFVNPAQQVSANYGVGLDGQVRQWVSENDTAWCNGNYASNLTTISIEHEDGGNYNGPRTPQLYSASSELVADICRRHNIPCDRNHIKGHREVIDRTRYPGGTACPDSLDLDRIIAGADAILTGAHAAAPAAPVASNGPETGRILVLPGSVPLWRVYHPAGPWTVGHEVAKLAPAQFGGLEYEIVGNPATNVYLINTQMFGQVAIYAGPDTEAQFKDKPAPAPAAAPTPPPAPTPVVPDHPYTVEQIGERHMITTGDRKLWNLNDTEWSSFAKNPVTTTPNGTQVTIKAIAHHKLGSKYYMPDATQPQGYNIADLADYVAPAPAPVPAAAAPTAAPQIVFEKFPAPVTYTTKSQPTDAVSFNTTDATPATDYQLNQGQHFVAAGRAKLDNGKVYVLNATAFGAADTTGQPAKYSGVNILDLDGAVDNPAPVPTPGSVVTPTAAPPVIAPPTASSVPGTVHPTPAPAPSPATNWKNTFKQTVGPLVAAETVIVKDLDGILPDIKLEAGKLIPKAGVVWKAGQKYVITIPSHAKGNWYGIPAEITKLVASDQRHKAEVVIENLWDKYHQEVEDELDVLFHEGMQFENQAKTDLKGTVARVNKGGNGLHGYDRVADYVARKVFLKKQK